jgi:hypothetical protein
MYFLRYAAMPSNTHPEHDRLGEAYICCWIVRRSLAAADKVARREIRKQQWRILERDCGYIIRESDYDDGHDGVECFRQARVDRQVFQFYLSPRFPVFQVTANVKKRVAGETAVAHYFLAAEAIMQKRDDVYDPGFWIGSRSRLAVASARKAIEHAGWRVTGILARRPCGACDLPTDFQRYYDEAEDLGACLVFVHDSEAK